jgi:hypothetical protein
MSDARRIPTPQSPPSPRARHRAEAIIARYIQDLAAATARAS